MVPAFPGQFPELFREYANRFVPIIPEQFPQCEERFHIPAGPDGNQ